MRVNLLIVMGRAARVQCAQFKFFITMLIFFFVYLLSRSVCGVNANFWQKILIDGILFKTSFVIDLAERCWTYTQLYFLSLSLCL